MAELLFIHIDFALLCTLHRFQVFTGVIYRTCSKQISILLRLKPVVYPWLLLYPKCHKYSNGSFSSPWRLTSLLSLLYSLRFGLLLAVYLSEFLLFCRSPLKKNLFLHQFYLYYFVGHINMPYTECSVSQIKIITLAHCPIFAYFNPNDS